MKEPLLYVLICAVCVALSGCGYRSSCEGTCYKTISVNYVSGDSTGQLTSALIYAISSNGIYEYCKQKADLRLEVALVDVAHEQIGYRRNRSPDGTVRKSIMPTEGRTKMAAFVTLLTESGKKVWGPRRIEADADYDYIDQDSLGDLSFVEPNGNRVTVLQFSLGQLESIAGAQEAALPPLYRKLSCAIVDAITNADLNSALSTLK